MSDFYNLTQTDPLHAYITKLPLRRLSNPSVPNTPIIKSNVNYNLNMNNINRKISVNVDDIDYIDEDDSAENDDDEIDDEFECVYIDYKSENITDIDTIIHNELFGNHNTYTTYITCITYTNTNTINITCITCIT